MNMTQMILRCLCVVLVCAGTLFTAFAQTGDEPDFTPDSTDFVFDFESDFDLYRSYGYFPMPYPEVRWSGYMQTGGYYSFATDLTSSAFAPTEAPFSCDNPYADDDDDDEDHYIMESWRDSQEGAVPEPGIWGLGVKGTMQTTFPIILTGYASLLCSDDVLYSEDRSRSFLNNDNELTNFKEITVFHVSEYIATAGGGLTFPLYGAFVDNKGISEDFRFASFYYLHVGASYSVYFDREVQQFAHIATHKDKIRFPNGTDTLRTTLPGAADSLANTSINVECALGWRLAISSFVFGLEVYATIPTEYALKDAAWRRTMGGLRFNLGF